MSDSLIGFSSTLERKGMNVMPSLATIRDLHNITTIEQEWSLLKKSKSSENPL